MKTALSVNINKVALIRNARGGNIPNLLEVAKHIESCGAHGITVHPRPDERHITYQDCYDLKEVVTTEFNIEGYPDERWMKMVLDVQPDQATLVPDPPEALTSNTGWDTVKHLSFLQEIIHQLSEAGIRTSIFLNSEPNLVTSAKETGTDRIELYTGPFAEFIAQYSGELSGIEHSEQYQVMIKQYQDTAIQAKQLGLDINAGHDLNTNNLPLLKQAIPFLAEVSIGQALVADALYNGFYNTIQEFLICLRT